MAIEGKTVAGKKWMLIVGWVLSAIPILMFFPMAVLFALTNLKMVRDGAVEKGYQPHHAPIIVGLEILCGLLYAIPQTAFLGAILLTGFLGGAVATHVRIDDPGWPAPVVFGVIVWLGLYFRDARLRALVPFRRGVRSEV